MMSNSEFIIGVDEAGRGPLAGPMAVAAVRLPQKLQIPRNKIQASTKYQILNSKLKDSKKLSEKQRREWYAWIMAHENVECAVTLVGVEIIDRDGIARACREGVARCVRRLGASAGGRVLLDGLLKAPRTYENQETITKGDEKEAAIALASIVAKVHRDRHMRRLAKKHPEYSFEEHKGYGTKKHYKLLKKYGPSEVHRKTFLRRLGLNEMTEGEAIEAVLQAERELTLSGKNLDTFARELEE